MTPEQIASRLRDMDTGMPARTPIEHALEDLGNLAASVLRMIDARREGGMKFAPSDNEDQLRIAVSPLADQKFPPGPPMRAAVQTIGEIGEITIMTGRITIAAIMLDTTGAANADGVRPSTAEIGDLVFVEVPPNCAVIGMPGRDPQDFVRLISLAHQIGAHWRVQEGVNAALIDELAALTAPKEDARG